MAPSSSSFPRASSSATLAWNSSSLFSAQQIQYRPIAGCGFLRLNHTLSLRTPRSRIDGADVFLSPRLRIDGAFLFRNPGLNFFSVDSERRVRDEVIAQAGRSKQRSKRYGRVLNTGKVKENTEKKKPSGPYRRKPDEYYKFGPFGPYSYKAPVVGTIQPITSAAEDYVFMWSTFKNLQEIEEADLINASISYDRRVQTFDESVGLQFFYVFARLPFKYENQPLWKEWSLVSEITIESGEVLDKAHLSSHLGWIMKNRITKYTGWIRPDLVYVRKPCYQVRFEPQLEFIDGLKKLLFETVGTIHEKDSYYGVFCQILGLDVDASHKEITSRYENAPEETRLACLEHLFSMHPVKLMYYVPYPHLSVWRKDGRARSSLRGRENEAPTLGDMDGEKQGGGYSDTTEGTDSEIEIGDWTNDENESENDDEGGESNRDYGRENRYDNESGSDDDEIESRYDNGNGTGEWDDLDSENENYDMGNESENYDMGNETENDDMGNESEIDEWDASSQKNRSRDASSADMVEEEVHEIVDSESKNKPFLRAAARPYTYVNFIREMVMLREILLERKKEAVAGQ